MGWVIIQARVLIRAWAPIQGNMVFLPSALSFYETVQKLSLHCNQLSDGPFQVMLPNVWVQRRLKQSVTLSTLERDEKNERRLIPWTFKLCTIKR